MRKMKGIIVAVLSLCLMASLAYAEERGTKAEAKDLLKKAVTLIKADGDKAYPQLQDSKGKFIMKDLYVYVFTAKDATVKVHPKMAAMVGKSWADLKDADGKAFVKEIIDGAKKKGSGSVDYKWTNPTTKKVDDKSAFYEKVGDVIAVSGFYK